MLLILVAVPFVLYWQRNALYDYWRLHGYNPPSAITSLASDVKMTDSARHIYYVNHPQLVGDAQTFRGYCTVAEQTIVLGCYRGPELGIYVFNVQDSRLAGIQQVTAAHEMLHAGYDRLSASNRKYVDGLLKDYFQNGLSDQRVIDTINSYKKTEPNDLINEMHSVFGTEVANLPRALEDYYKLYFSDRKAVVSYSTNYENVFTSRDNQAKALKTQLDSLIAKIDAETSALKSQLDLINTRRVQLDSQRNSNPNDYNAAVDSFNDQVDSYNAKIAIYQADVGRYNQILDQYNQIAGDLRSLYNSINANLKATSAQ